MDCIAWRQEERPAAAHGVRRMRGRFRVVGLVLGGEAVSRLIAVLTQRRVEADVSNPDRVPAGSPSGTCTMLLCWAMANR